MCSIPAVDIFAGPGGLGEGFSSYETDGGHRPFRINLSIEKEKWAHQTLTMRSFFRQFGKGKAPDAYYDQLSDSGTPLVKRLGKLCDAYPQQAHQAAQESWCSELGKTAPDAVYDRIARVLGSEDTWVLLGGPPCQAYSIAGRSRNRGKQGYKPHEDKRQYLYVEYLQVIADHRPAAFIMENVKGLLSATVQNQRMFERILDDLENPAAALNREGRSVRRRVRRTTSTRYEVFPLVQHGVSENGNLGRFVVPMERYGIPQARHRLILLGVRRDVLGSNRPATLSPGIPVTVKQVIEGLPRVRSGLSRQPDSAVAWRAHLQEVRKCKWFRETSQADCQRVLRYLEEVTKAIRLPRKDRGGEFIAHRPDVGYERTWYLDDRIAGVWNHSTRAHIIGDLHRYLFASCYALAEGRSPVLADFPEALLPQHENVKEALQGGCFADRFRVQVRSRPSTTITSHISRDGHYYIHYDPSQCRSLTVREAARIQTFPDNYFFCGPRTAQYTQVGNAVPPLLSCKIAGIVWDLLERCGVSA